MTFGLRTPAAALVGSFLCVLLSPVVLGFYTFTVFFETLSGELGWGRGILALAITVGTLSIAITAPVAGRLADRGGARRIILVANFALIGVVAAMALLCSTLVGLYVALGLIGILAACYMVAIPRIVSSWFDRRRGLALGIVMSGAGLGSALIAPLTAYMIAAAGWQTAYLLLAALALLVSFPAALLFLHEAPRTATTRPADRATDQRPRINRQLLLLSAAFLLMGAGLHGVLINFSPMLTDRGITAPVAAEYFAAASIAMFAGRLGCGYLLDRWPANRVGAVLMLAAALGILILDRAENGPILLAGAGLFGLGVSAELDVLSYVISRLYPIGHFSRFFAFAYSAFMIGTSMGPPLLGALYDHSASYDAGTTIAAILVGLSALLLTAMERTRTHVSSEAIA